MVPGQRRWRPGASGAAALALILLVAAACAAPQAKRQAPSPTAAPGTKAEAQAGAEAGAEAPTAPPAKADAAAKPEDDTPEPTRKVARRVIDDDPSQLMGLAPAGLDRLLGRPSLLRSEPPAQVWQYTAADCVLDVFLYTDAATPDEARVTYFEIRGGAESARGTRACFAAILESRPAQDAPRS
jgi:hypothetical protein